VGTKPGEPGDVTFALDDREPTAKVWKVRYL
jgi:hypothetical protein